MSHTTTLPAIYSTGWAGGMTFQQIHDDLAHYASNVMKNFNVFEDELPDCLQNGFIALWKTLIQQPDFLEEKSRKQTVFFILARCKISTIRYQADQYDSLDALITSDRRETADEHLIDGMQYRHGERWAGWATEIDMRIDIERVMCKLAEKYADSFQHLVALYFVTTQVARKDAAKLAGTDSFRWYKNYVLPVLADVQFEFAQVFMEGHSYNPPGDTVLYAAKRFTLPYREWREKYQQGNATPADKLLVQYAHTPCLIQALRAQLDGQTYHEAAEHYGRNFNSFKRHMKHAARLLKAAYAA